MSVVGSQQQTFLRLVGEFRPFWRRDVNFPDRIQAAFARHKEFGSRDRRLYRELVYTSVRYLPWIEPLFDTDAGRAVQVVAWLASETRDTTSFRAETCGDWPMVSTLSERAAFLGVDPATLLPDWFRHECPLAFESPELDAQVARAPLWLRLQTAETAAIAAEFQLKPWRWQPAAVLPSAWRMLDEADVTQTDAYAHGAFEVQDLGSQFVLESIGVEPGGQWLDACAGAGGKTLQLARMLGSRGRIDAYDTRKEALAELVTRARRVPTLPVEADESEAAGGAALSSAVGPGDFASIRVLKSPPGSKPARRPKTPVADVPSEYDGVLVDAPCSGSGTWRRAPHLKWCTSPKVVADRATVQVTLLERFSALVRPGGRLVYATCSLARRENEAVVTGFLAARPDFEPVVFARDFGSRSTPEGLTILPAKHDTDGFFVASLRRR